MKTTKEIIFKITIGYQDSLPSYLPMLIPIHWETEDKYGMIDFVWEHSYQLLLDKLWEVMSFKVNRWNSTFDVLTKGVEAGRYPLSYNFGETDEKIINRIWQDEDLLYDIVTLDIVPFPKLPSEIDPQT